jgi:hypothetical protein
MADQRVDRRQILKGAGALGAVGALAAFPNPMATRAGDGKGNDHGVLGSWIFNVTNTSGPGAGAKITAFITFVGGGGLVETDLNAGRPNRPSGPGHGAWISTSEGGVAFKFIQQRFDAQGYAGTLQITGLVTLEEGGNTLHGTDTAEVRDTSGTLLVSFTQMTTATRISVG